MEALNWGILGASRFARMQMGRAIHAAEGARLAALATESPDKAEAFRAFAPDLRVHASYDALLADPTIDAVYIPLPHTLHIAWSRKALAAGKHVLTEKPIALLADEIDPLIADRDATGLVATEAFMIVNHPQWARARTLLADGAIGALRHVTAHFTYNNPDPANIRNRPETGGGSLPDIGVYTIGATRWTTGQEPHRIRSAALTMEDGVEVTARVQAEFDGFSADWLTSMRLFAHQEVTFHGEGGLLRLSAPFNPQVFGEARLELRHAERTTVERFPAANHYIAQVEAFGRAVRDGAALPWTLEDARGTQSVIDAIRAEAAGR